MATAVNTGKVIAGGMLAGVVMFIGDFGMMSTVMKDSMAQMASQHSLVMDESVGGLVGWVADDLLFGLLAVWLYAGIRPRFGAGVKTAVYAGLAVWAAVMLTMFGFSSMGLFPMSVFLTMGLLWLVVVVIGTIAGAWVYKEAA